jgi:beta-aspartyl-peptidase (threonine type)
MNTKYIRPYLFIILFLAFPLLLIPIIKVVNNNFIEKSTTPNAAGTVIIKNNTYGLVIHGGAGNITKEMFTTEQEAQYKAKLYEALQTGISKLSEGDSAVNVVVSVIKILEDSPLFNAGKGAVFTHNGKNELDASIMDGKTKNAGAVASVTTIKNPITAAYAVMRNSEHVFLSGKGAEEFAKTQHLDIVSPEYFFTQKRWNSLQKVLNNEKNSAEEKHGTVGCVVLDKYGNLAAGTSTGGMTNKKYGRIGDSPVIGAGTYADNNTCAVSATGHGEYFIRYNVTYDISAQMKYLNQNVVTASTDVINELNKIGGKGGVICIDKNGNISMPFNTSGMFRGYCLKDNEPHVLLYKK